MAGIPGKLTQKGIEGNPQFTLTAKLNPEETNKH